MKRQVYLIFIILCLFISSCKNNKYEAVYFFINSKEYDKAELILNKLNKKEKKSFEYNYLNGLLLVKQSIAGNKREALKFFLKANEYKTNDYLNNLMISKMYYEVNDLNNAESFALKADDLFLTNRIETYENDVKYLLAKIYLKKGDYENALSSIKTSLYPSDRHVIFLHTKILDLKNDSKLLDDLYIEYRNKEYLSDDMKIDYLDYLFIEKRIKDAELIINEFITEKSEFLNYYGYLFKSFIAMLNHNFREAESFIEKSYDYTIEDSSFIRYKMKFFYKYLTEENPIKIYNSFLIYKFFYEKNEKETITAKDDLSEILEYFKNDIYFNLLQNINNLNLQKKR